MTNNNHYDVIIIGTGAGGGTLAYKLAPSGKKILLLERGDYVPREKDNWSTRAVNLDAKYNTKEAWRDVDGKELHPHTNYFVCAKKTSGRFAITVGSRQRGPSATTSWSRITPKLNTSIRCTVTAVKIQRNHTPARPTNRRPSVTSNGFSIFTMILSERDLSLFTCRLGFGSMKRTRELVPAFVAIPATAIHV